MRTPVALMQYMVTAPAEVAAPVVAASVTDGVPITVRGTRGNDWLVMDMHLSPIGEHDGANLSLIVTVVKPKQLYATNGSHGAYLKNLRARMHTWLHGGGSPVLAAKRNAEYKEMGSLATDGLGDWGLPRAPGRKQRDMTPPATAKDVAGKRGPDKAPRNRRRDLYVTYESPAGNELNILARFGIGANLVTNGAYIPRGWKCYKRYMEGNLGGLTVAARLKAIAKSEPQEDVNADALLKFLRGGLVLTSRQPIHFRGRA